MVSNEYKYIFVANMKTGTQSIIQALNPYSEGLDASHYMAKELKYGQYSGISDIHAKRSDSVKIITENWDNYFKFAFVRNPWDHFLSLYHYIKKNGGTELPFEEFVKEQYQNGYGCLSDWNFTCLWDRISENDVCIVDYVARFEDMDNEWAIICEKIGIPYKKLGKINTTNRDKDYTKYYNEDTKNMIGELYKKDIEKFGYEF